MKIQVDSKAFCFGGHRFFWDLYYFEGEEWNAPTLADTYKKILLKWADVLERNLDARQTILLPFAPDDQDIECLRVTYWYNHRISFSWVELDDNGYPHDFGKMDEFCTSPHEVRRESPEFGWCEDEEFISALRDAEVIDDPLESKE